MLPSTLMELVRSELPDPPSDELDPQLTLKKDNNEDDQKGKLLSCFMNSNQARKPIGEWVSCSSAWPPTNSLLPSVVIISPPYRAAKE